MGFSRTDRPPGTRRLAFAVMFLLVSLHRLAFITRNVDAFTPTTSRIFTTSGSCYSAATATAASTSSTANRCFLAAKYSDLDENDDDDEIDLSDKDWRSFRAKLVMSEPGEEEGEGASAADGPTSTAKALLESEDDLDGIGAVFASKPSTLEGRTADDTDDDEIASRRSAEKTLCPTKFTPLDPEQWAYDSGGVIEQGAIILGGVEQDFGFGLRQQYFHKSVILVLDHDERRASYSST